MSSIHKGYCPGCPYDVGTVATDTAFNLGCLPSTWEIFSWCEDEQKAWACHSDASKVCCGYAAYFPDNITRPLMLKEGIHGNH